MGFELWTVNAGSIFDNILVTDDKAYADAQAEKTWAKIKEGEKEAKDACACGATRLDGAPRPTTSRIDPVF